MCGTEHQKDTALWILSGLVSLGVLYFICGDLLLAGIAACLFGAFALTPPGEAAWLWLLDARRPSGQEVGHLEDAVSLLQDKGVKIPRYLQWRILDDPARRTYAFTRHVVVTVGMLATCEASDLAESLGEQLASVGKGQAVRAQCAWGCMAGTLSLLFPWAVYVVLFQAVCHASPSGSRCLAGAIAVAAFGLVMAVVLWALVLILMTALRVIIKALAWVSGAFLVGTVPERISKERRAAETAD